MRRVMLGLVLWVVGMLAGCATPQPKVQAGQATTYEVLGMDCPGCHGGLEKNLTKIPGVVGATANWKQKTVTVHVMEGATIEEARLRKAVEDSNFTLGPVLK